MVQKNKARPKRYLAIVKIGNNPDGRARCVKYHFDDLLKFTDFLDRKWKGWRWYNLYSNSGATKGKQIANFTNKSRPTIRSV